MTKDEKIQEVMVLVNEYANQAIEVYTDIAQNRKDLESAWIAIQSKLRELIP